MTYCELCMVLNEDYDCSQCSIQSDFDFDFDVGDYY